MNLEMTESWLEQEIIETSLEQNLVNSVDWELLQILEKEAAEESGA